MKSSKKYRVKSSFRFITFLVIVIGLVVGTAGFFLGHNTANAIENSDYVTVQVEPGDTLWDIAKEYKDDRVEMRDAVYAICELNDITADEVQAGMQLTVPVTL